MTQMSRSDILEELRAADVQLQEFTRDHDEYVRAIVSALRHAGATWEEIGEALGISKQAAWERFR